MDAVSTPNLESVARCLTIEEGNTADSSRLLPMIKRIQSCYGKLPCQVAADAAYASKENQ